MKGDTVSSRNNIPLLGKSLAMSGKTIVDLKAEAILIHCYSFFKIYLEHEEKDENEALLPGLKKNDTNIIKNTVLSIYSELEECVMREEELRDIILNAGTSPLGKIKAETVRPIAIFFDAMIKTFNKEVKEKQTWVPELIALYLIYHYTVEESKVFKKFPSINALNLDKILEVYAKTDIALKKQHKKEEDAKYRMQKRLYISAPYRSYALGPNLSIKNNARIWNSEDTIISRMNTVAVNMVRTLLSTKYKINENRQSKTRKKKKR